MDLDATMKDAKIDDNQVAQDMARAMLETMKITMAVDSGAKQISISMAKESSPAKAFTVVSDSGNTLVLKDAQSGQNMTFEFLGAYSLVLRDEGGKGKNMVMKKVK
jgi:hypothetical protein